MFNVLSNRHATFIPKTSKSLGKADLLCVSAILTLSSCSLFLPATPGSPYTKCL